MPTHILTLAAVVCALGASAAVAGDRLVAHGASLEQVVRGQGMPDGPAWDGRFLWFPDVKKRQLLRYDPADGQVTVVLSDAGVISATAMDPQGRLLISENPLRRISRLDASGPVVIVQHAEQKPPRNPNDLAVSREGAIYHTLTATDEVWYTSPDGSRSEAAARVPKPNGIALSPDGRTLYVSAFAEKKIYAFEVQADGSLGGERVLATMDDGTKDLGADGMTCDSAGNIYCAGPKHIWVWSPRGELLTKIEVPQKPINCEFADPDLKSLYITAGDSIYRLRMNVAGGR